MVEVGHALAFEVTPLFWILYFILTLCFKDLQGML